MPDWLTSIFPTEGFMPHGHCYLWQPSLVWLHVISDLAIGGAYVVISVSLYQLVRIIKLPFSAMAISFGVFIAACSCTHLVEVWNLWHANYWWAGVIKALTALASVTTALWLIKLRPQIIYVAQAARAAELRRLQLEVANQTLEKQKFELEQSQKIRQEQQKMLVHSAKMSALGEMASGIAHEINSPLAIIILRMQQVQRGIRRGKVDLQTVADEADLIVKTASRIGTIVKGLQTFAREGDTDPFKEVCLADVVVDVLALCQSRFQHQSVGLTVNQFADDLVIYGSSVQICQVILNLLNNAHDAASKAANKWIRLEVADHGEMVEIAVTDSGGGIPPDIQASMMQPFFTTKEVGKGTGLGLSISQGIVENHGGSLTFDPQSEETRFVVLLPKAQAQPRG